MFNFLHFIAGIILLYAIFAPLIFLWESLLSYKEIVAQKEVSSHLQAFLFQVVVSGLLVLFSVWLAS